MKKSRELNMSIPEITDKIDVREISENFEIIDKILSANLVKRNTSTTEINVTAYPPYYIMKNTENNPINYFDPIFEETFTLGPLEEKKFFINAPQSLYFTSDVQIEYDYFIPIQEAINDISPGGTSDYDNLNNKPQINGNVLSGDKTASELGLADINDIPDISASTTNGNIKINGTEINVYTHPTGTNPHGTTKSDVGLGNVGNFKAVSTVASQGLTDTEKSNARANIGAGTSSFSGNYNDLTNKPTIPTSLPASDTTSTYSSTGTAPVNGKAVASAIGTLDVAAVSVGTAETIKSISETDGKIAVTKQSIAIKSNQVNGMTSYSKATSPSAIATSDSLNAAVGKLEYKVDTNETNISNANTQIADIYNRCGGGKNLFNFTAKKGATFKGITVTNNNDGTFTVSGTSTERDAYYDFYYSETNIPSNFKKGKTYRMVINGSDNIVTFRVLFYTSSWGAPISTFSNQSFTIPNNATGMIIRISIQAANTVVNSTISLMITEQFITDNKVVPYVLTNAELQEQINTLTARVVALEAAATSETQ